MPGFPDKFMPFMNAPPGSRASAAGSKVYGGVMRRLRKITEHKADREPRWRGKGSELTTGYKANW